MQILIAITVLCLILSLAVDQRKTFEGIKRGSRMFLNLLPALLTVLILVSVFLYLVPEQVIVNLLGAKSGFMGVGIAAIVGSISLLPAFVSFPLARILLDKGVSYTVVAVFITTLIMVGVLTLPIEFKYFGRKAALMRNFLSFIGAIIIGFMVGLFL